MNAPQELQTLLAPQFPQNFVVIIVPQLLHGREGGGVGVSSMGAATAATAALSSALPLLLEAFVVVALYIVKTRGSPISNNAPK